MYVKVHEHVTQQSTRSVLLHLKLKMNGGKWVSAVSTFIKIHSSHKHFK